MTTELQLLIYLGLLCVVGSALITLTIVVPKLLGTKRLNSIKLEPYECGVPAIEEGARGRVSVKFYLVAILFILFDVETVFLLPWAAEYKSFGALAGIALVEVLVFLAILAVGYVYVWKRGALDWD